MNAPYIRSNIAAAEAEDAAATLTDGHSRMALGEDEKDANTSHARR